MAGVAGGGAQLVRTTNGTLALPAALPTGSYTASNAFPGLTFSFPVALVAPPGETNRLFVVEQGGAIRVITNLAAPTSSLFLNLTSLPGGVRFDGESGVLGLAFHPEYAANRYFYVFYSLLIGGNRHQRVARMQASATNANVADASSLQPLIDQRDQASNHNGGDLHFGPDGYLYVSVGDEGSSNDSLDNARFITNDFFAAILRIDVDSRTNNLAPNSHPAVRTNALGQAYYRVPADNPFLGVTQHMGMTFSSNSVRTEIWATGLRNPWRMAFDPDTSDLWVGDVGQGAREEINVMTNGGGNYGWSFREGSNSFTSGPGGATPPAGFNPVNPIWDYPRTSGNSVSGGIVYRGDRFADLRGRYIFGDYGTDRVWALARGPSNVTVQQIATVPDVVAFGPDPRNGDILAAGIGTAPGAGTIYRIERTSTSGTAPPALLSGTGAFSNLTNLAVHSGIVSYDLNVPFWSDYAAKTRWFSITNLSGTIGFSGEGNWTFPRGMVWIKHFDLEMERGNPASRRKIETRFLVKTADSAYGLSYRWSANETNAFLVPEEGTNVVFQVVAGGVTNAQTWRYPSRGECLACHTAAAGWALGFNTRQLNRGHTHGALTTNQIQMLSDAGYFSGAVTGIHQFAYHPPLADATHGAESRARAYLAVNCAQCHQPFGPARGLFDARAATPTDDAGLINGEVLNTLGNPGARVLVPGDQALSVLLQRLIATNAPRMPPLATFERDTQAVALVQAWIAELPSRQTFAQWQIANFGATNAPGSGPQDDPDGDGEVNDFEFDVDGDPLLAEGPWPVTVGWTNGMATLGYRRPANRAVMIEFSPNQTDWRLWDVQGNRPWYSAAEFDEQFTGEVPGDAGFFRFRFLRQ